MLENLLPQTGTIINSLYHLSRDVPLYPENYIQALSYWQSSYGDEPKEPHVSRAEHQDLEQHFMATAPAQVISAKKQEKSVFNHERQPIEFGSPPSSLSPPLQAQTCDILFQPPPTGYYRRNTKKSRASAPSPQLYHPVAREAGLASIQPPSHFAQEGELFEDKD
ncbi:unnamed protein product [Cylicocyclus nassatus]|uniref:Uncharacterized protein n=1 Tax=Cylicocyclus nassatus TaxID=53992 RepID=A0AA36GG51_CYLNA|nr:unnamed protein product [Cylicocyclus nassatus]